ncbi:helix-turn-helix transcriptional regulator [Agrobacterium sp. SORGH_AS 787]|uniref:helix-turn-helix transcriptional regulator n=1 Tax=Agrobacterium sp. SORGH_AS 787 TaxID=3041775 RepID=UPI002789241F|nr:transcriptional regulator with XRE-family HTH domain [Rhizobium sp. SORGH_AS_0787]
MLSEALRLVRVYHDLKQHELAERLEISKSYLSEIESGKKTPTIELIEKYSKEFGIPASSILFFSENLEDPSKAAKVKGAIAGKVLQFLQFVEART